jgi:tetratricopeptide (TPR) repeat protein
MPQRFALSVQVLGATQASMPVRGLLFLLLTPCAWGQKAPLNQAEVLGRLAAGNAPSYIAHLVKTRGVSFSVSRDFLYRVRLAGGEGILLERLLAVEEFGQPQSVSGREARFEHLAKCAELIHTGASDRSKKECRVAIEENPNSPWPLLATARLLQQYDLTGNVVETFPENPGERKELLRSATRLAPGLAMAHQMLGATLDSGEGAAELEKARWLDIEQLEISETTAREIPRIGYVDGGEDDGFDSTASSDEPAPVDSETARHMELDPDLASNHRRLAAGYVLARNFEKVESEFVEAIRLEPDNPAIRSDLAAYYLSRHNGDAALAQLREGIRIAPFAVVQHIFLADTLESFGRTSEAISELQNLTAMYPAAMAASDALVELYLRQNDPKAAIAELRRSLKASSLIYGDQSKFVEARYQDLSWLAQLLKEGHELDEAAEQYLFLLRYQPDSAKLHHDYGNVLLERGDVDHATREYSEAMRLEPSISSSYQR